MPPKLRKIALMGFRSVGKSSLTIQFVENHFVESYDPTIDNTFQKTLRVGEQDYILQLVDTAGQDEYSVLPQSYFMNIDGYILVYSVNDKRSFEIIQYLYEKLSDMKGDIGCIPIVLVGNKCDLTTERQVSQEAGKKIAEKWKIPFLETSAKNNQTTEMMTEMWQKIVEKIKVPFLVTSEKDQSVAKVFQQIISTSERADGNFTDKNGCCMS